MENKKQSLIWNPLDYGIRGVPLMVPAHLYNHTVSNLLEALSVAIKYAPKGEDLNKIEQINQKMLDQNDRLHAELNKILTVMIEDLSNQ
jgi:hypothetical protein